MLGKMKKLFNTKEEKKVQYEVIQSPITGDIKPLKMVNDAAFAEGAMGDGIAVEPHRGRIVSPVNGVIANVAKTKHSIFLISDQGAEVLIHVGLDTVKLKGEYFTVHVTTGQQVHVGELLLVFDIAAIKQAGYETTTPIIIANTPNYANIHAEREGTIVEGEPLLKIFS